MGDSKLDCGNSDAGSTSVDENLGPLFSLGNLNCVKLKDRYLLPGFEATDGPESLGGCYPSLRNTSRLFIRELIRYVNAQFFRNRDEFSVCLIQNVFVKCHSRKLIARKPTPP